MKRNGFTRGLAWARIRTELHTQGAFTERRKRATEVMLWGMLTTRKEQIGVGPSDDDLARKMTEWLIIREELEGE